VQAIAWPTQPPDSNAYYARNSSIGRAFGLGWRVPVCAFRAATAAVDVRMTHQAWLLLTSYVPDSVAARCFT
jgi:hypothetical protein